MKKLHQICMLAIIIAGFSFASCKGKDKDDNTTTVVTPAADTSATASPTPPAPVVIANDEALKSGVNAALKDFSTVKGEVDDSVINLTGSIKRSDWQKLMPTLSSLHPKRINSAALTIK